MILDQKIKVKISEYERDSEVHDFTASGLVLYFSNFHPFDYWIQNNRDKARHEFLNFYELRLDDFIEFLEYLDNTDDKWWDDEYSPGYDRDIVDMRDFVKEAKRHPDRTYIYFYTT